MPERMGTVFWILLYGFIHSQHNKMLQSAEATINLLKVLTWRYTTHLQCSQLP